MAIDVETYYKLYGPMVLRRCRRLLKNEEQAADAMQDTFVNLLVHSGRLKHDSPSSLLYRIATNTCLNKIRAGNRRPEDARSPLIERIASLDETESKITARNLLSLLFSKERESTRVIATLHLLDGLTLEEVAREVGMSVSGVRKRLRPLRSKLHELKGVSQ